MTTECYTAFHHVKIANIVSSIGLIVAIGFEFGCSGEYALLYVGY